MTELLTFDPTGQCVRMDATHGDYPLPPEFTSLLPFRYALKDDVVVDLYPGSDDAEATELHDAAMEALQTAVDDAPFRLTTRDFRVWLGAERRIAVRALAKDDPIVFDFMESLELADEVWSEDSDLDKALTYLESKGAPFEGLAGEFLTDAIKYKL